MASPKSERKGSEEKKKKGRLSEKASSFHGRDAGAFSDMVPRPKTVPDLLAGGIPSPPPKLTKLLVNVTIQRSPGPIHVLMPPEATVKDLITVALRHYVNEARRPVLPSTAASAFDLHYSQFSLERLDREAEIVELGSRNFFLCPRHTENGSVCVSKEEENEYKFIHLPWQIFANIDA
ncbi:uncharacterized protein LOC125219725 isoform X2 [Salvia hispanica]|uniref:uncharacterized protein LOC125219725 isoform X2 n=1 Tax=Salvia hispanica TaxID=49212 RepID=UPI0020097662|nr:uncharacterized protein LOC125219725 isoform X2 [Salvia hispanica]